MRSSATLGRPCDYGEPLGRLLGKLSGRHTGKPLGKPPWEASWEVAMVPQWNNNEKVHKQQTRHEEIQNKHGKLHGKKDDEMVARKRGTDSGTEKGTDSRTEKGTEN